jgi:hypothetical protein
MIIRKLPLVKLLKLADQHFLERHLTASRGRPYTYSERTMFLCFILKAVKRLDDCSGLYHYLEHETNAHIRALVGLLEKLPHLKTFQRRFEESAPVMRRQLIALAQALAQQGVISFEMLAIDGTVCDALGPDWHKLDKLYAHIPEGLRNLDLTAEWAKSGYRGWSYGYKALALCNCGFGEPAVFVDGWVERGNVSETVSVREELSRTGLPKGNRLMLADSGFDDQALFEVCWQDKSLLITPLTPGKTSPQERYLKEALYVDYLNCGIYGRRSTSIEPLFGYVKELFDLQILHQHGLYKSGAEILGAMAAYNLIVLYNHCEGLTPRAVKAFLDVI